MNILKSTLFAFLLSTACVISVSAETVKLEGAVTMEKKLTPQKAALESQTGATLEIVGSGSGRGLAALSQGTVQIALIGGSLKGLADSMNKDKPGSVDTKDMQPIPVTSIPLGIVAHPAVGIKSVTSAQLKDVLSGKVTNWKDVGGADVPVKVVLPFAGDGARISIEEVLMKGTEFPKDAIVRSSSRDVSKVIAQLPGSCSFLTFANIEGAVTTLSCDQEFAMPCFLVTKGEPSPVVKKVLDAVKAVFEKK